MKEIIPHSRPTIGADEMYAAAEVIRSGHISQGERVREFEEALAAFLGVKGVVAVNSGTSALHLGLLAVGVEAEDRVLMPSYLCTAPLNAVYHAGGEPRFCDIEVESLNLSADSVKENKRIKTKAVIVPHMFGAVADLEKINEAGLILVEDIAQAIGASYGKGKAGSFGKFSIASFYATKMMGCGEGGAVISNDQNVLNFVRDRRDYDEVEDYKIRYNYKMTDIQAAIGLVQLSKLPDMIRIRQEIAAEYDRAFKGLDVVLPQSEFDHIYYRYVVRVQGDITKIIASLKERGVNCEKPIYKPLHRYFELRSGFRNTDEVYSSAISIPIYPSLSSEEKERVVEVVKEVLS